MVVIVEYIRYVVPVVEAEAFEQAYRSAAEHLRSSPHCHDFELDRCVEEPERWILRITWTSVDDHIDGFRGSDGFPAFLADVGRYVPAIEEMQHYEPTAVAGDGSAPAHPPTLYEWAGGGDALAALFRRFYALVAVDDLLAPLFAGMDPAHPDHVAAWVGEVFGGPDTYTRGHGGYENMLAHHVGKEIGEEQRRRWVALLVDAADDVGLPDDPEFRAAFVGYLEWGSRLAVANSGRDAAPVAHAPVPRWGWGVAPPWDG